MKVIVIHNSYKHRGGEDAVFEQEVKLLRRYGHHVIVYQRSNSEIDDFSGLRRLRLARETVWSDRARDEVARLISQENPTLVHVHNTFPLISPSIYWACREAGVPVVQTLHNYRLLCPGANLLREGKTCERCLGGSLVHSVVHSCYRDSRASTAVLALMLQVHRVRKTWDEMIDRYIVLSDFAARKFAEAGLPAKKLVVKPNFIDPDPGVRKGPGEYALYIGRLSAEKGVDTLLQSWKQMRASIPLLIIGDGPLREELRVMAQCDPRVTFSGLLSRSKVLEALKCARFLVVPSRCYEAFPLVIAEAYACGIPVIASGLGAMQELVVDGRTGFLFRAGDGGHLAQLSEWAWSHAAELRCMGDNCRAEFESKYSAERNYQMLIATYRQVTSGQMLYSQSC